MHVKTANRLEGIGEYYFSKKLRELDELNKAGKKVINLGIGSPDLPPHPDVIRTLQDEVSKPAVHGYQSYRGAVVLRKAIRDWYRKWYDVELDPGQEILPLIGSKEGIMHVCMTYLNKGDRVLVPNPGYPTYQSAVMLAGGTCVEYKLTEKNNYEPDLKRLWKKAGGKIKLMFVNYPHMPTGRLPAIELFERLVFFAKKHGILLIHDNPYSFILNEKPLSMLSVEGARDVVIELNSLSKSHNMAGWRVGMVCAAKERIEEILRFKSNMDSGMFLPVQLAAVQALNLDETWFIQLNKIYSSRREMVFRLLDQMKCSFKRTQAGLFVWAQIPETSRSAYSFSEELLRDCRVFITPGGIFGSAGKRFVRLSLCLPEEKIEEAITRVKDTIVKPSRS
jgi:LL-diaminopimelate aminotransferase